MKRLAKGIGKDGVNVGSASLGPALSRLGAAQDRLYESIYKGWILLDLVIPRTILF